MSTRYLVRGALLVALALVLQSLRLVLPLPPLVSTFIIGTLVHMMLALTLRVNGLPAALLLSVLLPVTAYLQGQLLLPVLVPVVWLGNSGFVVLLRRLAQRELLQTLLPPVGKACVMLGAAWGVIMLLGLTEPAMRKTVLFAMSVPQLVTGVAGLLLARKVYDALLKRNIC